MTRWIPQGSPHRLTVVQCDVGATGSGMQVSGMGSKHLNVPACLRNEPPDHGIGDERSGQDPADGSLVLRRGSADLQHGQESMGRSLAKREQTRTSASAAIRAFDERRARKGMIGRAGWRCSYVCMATWWKALWARHSLDPNLAGHRPSGPSGRSMHGELGVEI